MSAGRSKIPILDRKMKEGRDYWVSRLSREIEPSNLRLDFERPAIDDGKTDAIELRLPDAVYQRLSKISGNSPELFYAVLLAALKACLHRYTGCGTSVIGAPSRRSGSEADEPNVLAPNVLAMFDEISGSMTFKQLLLSVRETVLRAFEKQSYPFDRLLSDLGLPEARNRCPLFDVALAYERLQERMPEVGNDITITFRDVEGGASGVIEFKEGLFRKDSIEHFAGHFQNLLREALEHVDSPIDDLEMVSNAERHRLIVEWNDTGREYPTRLRIHQLFEERASQTPGAIALTFQEEALTYHDLNTRANQLAHFLRRAGVGPEVVVGLCMERSPDLVIGLLAVLKAGGAYLPLDPSYPAERLAFMIEDARPKVVLSHERASVALADCNANVLRIDTQWPEIAGESTDNPRSGVTAENLAYVIYTSGSTGRPKGVMIEHSSVCNLALAQISAFHINPRSRLLQFASSSFDASVSEIFTALVAGARLCLAPREAMLPGPPLSDLLERERISVVTLPPGALATMSEQGGYPELKTLVVAGEACGGQVVRRWSRGRRFINAYGPTEATVCATMEEEAEGAESGSIGRAMSNVKVYVLDGRMKASGVGVAGEIYVGGEGVGRGYLGRAEQTAERFLPDPYAGEAGARMYRTGDIGRRRGDGRVEYVGRADDQVKVRGYRIELGEVEAALLSHSGVADCAVIVREVTPEDRRLVAYMRAGDEAPSTKELQAFLKAKLPDYMVPSAFEFLESFPTSPSGKVDRRALALRRAGAHGLSHNYVAPTTPVEEELASIWQKVLGVEKVGIEDNFFELGGHSLMVTQVVSRVRESFGVEVPLGKVFDDPTIACLASVISDLQKERPAAFDPAALSIPRMSTTIDEQLAELGLFSDENREEAWND